MRFRVKIKPPCGKRELDLVHEVALANGDGYIYGKKFVTLHELTEHGLDRIETELPHLIVSVHREDV